MSPVKSSGGSVYISSSLAQSESTFSPFGFCDLVHFKSWPQKVITLYFQVRTGCNLSAGHPPISLLTKGADRSGHQEMATCASNFDPGREGAIVREKNVRSLWYESLPFAFAPPGKKSISSSDRFPLKATGEISNIPKHVEDLVHSGERFSFPDKFQLGPTRRLTWSNWS